VARSQIHALKTLGVPELRVIGPKTAAPGAVERSACASSTTWPRTQGLRRGHHAAAAERAHERRAAAVGGRVLQVLRAHRREARARQARRDRDAPGADEPRRRDRFARCRRPPERDPAAGDLRHRGADGGDVDAGVPTHEDRDRNGRVVDPGLGRDKAGSIYIADGKIAALDKAPDGFRADETIDAKGLVGCPGLVDLSARLREPGFEYKATLESEMRAAAAGGVTTLACPPDTDPPLDEPGLVEMLKRRAAQPRLRARATRWARSPWACRASASRRWPSSPRPAASASRRATRRCRTVDAAATR
jgi:hypothetical protein